MRSIVTVIPGVDYASDAQAQRWFDCGGWIDMTIGEAMAQTAARKPDALAYISDERTITLRALHEESDRLAGALALRFNAGDRAIFQMGTTVETAITLIAAYKAGVVPVCAVPQYREIEIRQLTRLSGARGYFVQADFSAFDLVAFAQKMMDEHDSLDRLMVSRGADDGRGESIEALIAATPLDEARRILASRAIGSRDVLSFQLSGGTTGVPKIIPRFHGEYLAHADGWFLRYGLTEADRFIWSLPLLHNAGQLYALIPTVLRGLSVVLMPRVDIRRMLELIETHRVTHALSIGPIAPLLMGYDRLRDHDLSSLRLFATMSRADVLEAFLGTPCVNLFGITEGLLMCSASGDPAFMRHRTQGSSGCAFDEIRIADPETGAPLPVGKTGELTFRGPSSLRGYFGAPEASREALTADGFFRSGDLMTAHKVDGTLCYTFEGRLRDNVNRGGEKIGCEEVEGLVGLHPAVAEARLVPMPDPTYGEKGCIFIIPRPGAQAPDVAALAAFLTGQGLAKFKCPERVEILDAFPVTRVGKLDRMALRRMAAEKATAAG